MGRWQQSVKKPQEHQTRRSKRGQKPHRIVLPPFEGAKCIPSQKLKKILLETPFTYEMVMKGLIRWLQPFDQDDLKDIESGIISSEQVKEYLMLWKQTNFERYEVLKIKEGM